MGCLQVFQCVSATCGYFYHPRCVAKLLHQDDEAAAEELAKNVAAGVSFACPSHHCCVCEQLENHMVRELQFAVCRRCPTSYHRKCLPRYSFDTETWHSFHYVVNDFCVGLLLLSGRYLLKIQRILSKGPGKIFCTLTTAF